MVHISKYLGMVCSSRGQRHDGRWPAALIPCFTVVASTLFGCGEPGRELTWASAEQPILRGTVDRDHPAVMLLLHRDGFTCTGTVIRVEEEVGFLLTAAHCVTEQDEDGAVIALAARDFVVVPGTDFAESTTAFSVQAIRVEPRYQGLFAADDLAVVRFLFGDEPRPAPIPALVASEDDLAAGSDLLLVGYGQTDVDAANTERRRVSRPIGDLDEELILYDQRDGRGACFGDSGGPALVTRGGQARVAAVISGGIMDEPGNCASGEGVAMRVSAYEAFIRAASR